jgi:hypothetical protein
MSKTKPMPVKIPAAAYDTLRELAAFAARFGWSALGIDRDDAPTNAALIEEAIRLLAARREPRGRAKR